MDDNSLQVHHYDCLYIVILYIMKILIRPTLSKIYRDVFREKWLKKTHTVMLSLLLRMYSFSVY